MKTRRRADPFISLALSVCLLSNSADASALPKPALQALPPVSVPAEFGNIQEFHPGTSGKTVIFIQDAHDVLQAQENIAALITHLVENQNVKTVYEEGFEGPVPTDAFFGGIEDSEIKRKVSYYFLDQLKIGGAEYAHINRSRDFRLIGADSVSDHLENVQKYAEAAVAGPELARDFEAAEKELFNLTTLLGAKPLLEFIQTRRKFEENKTDFAAHLRKLCRLYLKAADAPFLEKEFPRIAEVLLAIDSKQAAALERVNRISALELSSELVRLEESLAGILLKSPRDQELAAYYRKVRLLKRLNGLELKPSEYESIREVFETFKTQDLADFLAREGKKTVVLPSRWERQLESARLFYEAALKRDENISEAMKSFAADPEEKTAVLVYGGFHAERIRKILEQSGIGYAVVSPVMQHFEQRHQDYYHQSMARGTADFPAPAAPKMARPLTVFEIEAYGKPDARQAVREELKRLRTVMPSMTGDLSQSVKDARLVMTRSELRSAEPGFEEIPEPESVEAEDTVPDVERRADKIVSKLLKHWYRGKTRSMGPDIEALKDRTVRAHPMGTREALNAAREFDEGLLALLDEAVAEEAERLAELKALTTDLFIYHAGIERELITKEGRKAFRERFGSDVPSFPVRSGDSFKAGELVPVFSELIANIRHVDPMGAMFFYRLDHDPRHVQYIIRDGGALTSRAEGVQRSIMGEEYPDEFGRVRKHGYHNAIDAVIRRTLGGEVIVQYDKKSERYFSGWLARLPWFRNLNRWMRAHFAMPLFGIEGEIIGRPWMETGVSKIKHKQGLKVKLLIPREGRSELRDFEDYARDYLQAGLKDQDKRFFNESPRQAEARYQGVSKENDAVWEIVKTALNASRDWDAGNVSAFVDVFERSFRAEHAGLTLRDWVASDTGVTLGWHKIKSVLDRGIGREWQAWEEEYPEVSKVQIRANFLSLIGVYERLYAGDFTKSSLENVLFRAQTLVRGYLRSEVVRAWTRQDTANVYEISGQYVGVDLAVPGQHQVRVTISNPRADADKFPYLTAVIDQPLAAAFLENIRYVNDLLKRWPFKFIHSNFSISYKKAAFVSLASAVASLLFGPAAGKLGLLIEFFMWGTAGVIWADVFHIKTRTKDRIDRFADMIQEQSGSWTVIPADEGEKIRSELRSGAEDPYPLVRFQNAMAQYAGYPEVSALRNVPLEEVLLKTRSLIQGTQPDLRRPLTLTRFLQQGTQGMNLTAVHAPEPVSVLAVRAHREARMEEIYYLELKSNPDEALEALNAYLAWAYPGKTFEIEAGVGLLPSGDQDVVMITVGDEGGRAETIAPYTRQQPLHSLSGFSTAQTYNQITGQTPPDVPKLLVTKFRSLDPKDQDRKRSELRSDEEGPVHSRIPGYGQFTVMTGDKEWKGNTVDVTDAVPVSFYFNIHTDRALEDPSKWIKARVHYKPEKTGEWKNDLEMTLYDNFENGVYRVGVTLPDDFSGSLTFNYSLDGGKTWPYWANQGPEDNYQILRSHEVNVRGLSYRISELSGSPLKSLFHMDARTKNPWGERYWEHLETAYGAKAITAVRDGVVAAYLVYQPTETGMTVLKYSVDTKMASKVILRELWRAAQKKLLEEKKEILSADVPFGDLKYFGKSRYQQIRKTDPAGKRDVYTIDYYSPSAEGEAIAAGEEIPVEYVPSDITFLRAWALRQTPGSELGLNFEELRQKYPNLSPYIIRRVLGEYSLKPRGGYPAEVLLIRDMNDDDIDDVMRIENGAFQDPDRWSPWGFQEKPKEDETREDKGGGLMDEVEEGFNRFKMAAVDEEGRVIGYLVYQIFEERIEIQKMAVDPAHRFSYIGSQMLEHIKWIMDREGLSFVSADVPAANEPVSQFFIKAGFEPLVEQSRQWIKISVTEFVYWHPEIDKSLLRSKEQAAKFLRKLREMKKTMEEHRQVQLSKTPKGVVEGLSRKEQSPWERDGRLSKIPKDKIKIRQALPVHAGELAAFAKTQSRFEWSEEALTEFMNRGGRVLAARSAGLLIGFIVYVRHGETYEILDAAAAARSPVGPMIRRFVEHIQEQNEDKALPPVRILWELPAEDYASAGGNFRTRAGFNFMDEYELKDGRTVYLLEREIRKIPPAEKFFRVWAQSLEQSPVTPQAVRSQAEEFGISLEWAEKILGRFGVPVVEAKPAVRQTLPEEAPYVSGTPSKDISIRWLIRRDMPEVLRIEEESFSSPWIEDDFLRALRRRNTIGMVAEDKSGKILGYMIYELYTHGHQLINFAVDPAYRGRKIGQQLIEKLKDKNLLQNRYWIRTVVRETDLRAQLFWKSQGFEAVQVSRGYFEDTGEDAYMFEYQRDYSTFEIDRAPREILAHPMYQLRAWAMRQDLEKLKTSIAEARYPEVNAVHREEILNAAREKRLKLRMLAALPEGSGRELPASAEEYEKLSSLSQEKVKEIAAGLGLKLYGADYRPVSVSVRGHKVEDFHAFELKVEPGRIDHRAAWTFSQFLGQVQKKGTKILTAEHDLRPAGYLAYKQEGYQMKVTRLGVLPELRFLGVDSRLFQVLKEIAEAEGLTGISVDVDEHDLHTQLILQKEGYRFRRLNHLRADGRGKFTFYLNVESAEGEEPPVIPPLKDIQALAVRYHEDVVVFELKVREAAALVILRTTLADVDMRLNEWFGIKALVHMPWKALLWKDEETGDVETRSFLSPVEINQIRDFIFAGIQSQAADAGTVREAKPSEHLKQDERSELRAGVSEKTAALKAFYEPLNQPGAALIDFRDLVTFTPEEIREAAVVISQRTEVRFLIHDVSPENENLLRFKELFKSFPNVVWTRSSGREAFGSLGPSFKQAGVVAFARKTRDLSGFDAAALKVIRFFAVTEGRPGTFAAALSYDPEQRLFQNGVVRDGLFHVVQPLLADLASRYLSQFAFAASA